MSAQYAVFVQDIGTVGDRFKVLGPGAAYDSVQIVRCPAGADVKIHLGQASDGIAFDEKDGWVDLCGELGGIFLTVNTASPGDTVTVLVFFAGGGAPAAGG